MLDQLNDRSDEVPAVTVDWMPWSHVMGGSAEFHRVLGEGGTLYIDDGKPTLEGFARTLRNLREIAPTRYASVPAGYAMLADALEAEPGLAAKFFSRLRTLAYGGARLPDELFERFQALAVRSAGHRVPFLSGYGATETAPSATFVFWPSERAGLIGLPQPGVTLKLEPLEGDRYEIRIRGDSVMPGYLNHPEATVAAFDSEGYYKTGDAAAFVDPEDPREGLIFAGRIAEEFKLASGVFVRVGALRVDVLEHAAPLLLDLVVTGPDRPFVAGMAWLNPAACRKLAGGEAPGHDELVQSPEVRAAIRAAIEVRNAKVTGGSLRIARLLLLTEPPSMDAGEITDKGYVNQRRVLERRAPDVERLYGNPVADDVLIFQ